MRDGAGVGAGESAGNRYFLINITISHQLMDQELLLSNDYNADDCNTTFKYMLHGTELWIHAVRDDEMGLIYSSPEWLNLYAIPVHCETNFTHNFLRTS